LTLVIKNYGFQFRPDLAHFFYPEIAIAKNCIWGLTIDLIREV